MIVVLTGAGLSAESGLGTFRDKDGIWTRYRIEDVATPQAFAANPALVHDFYNMRRATAAAATPNPAHHALARLAREGAGVLLVTQNVDDLLEKAGAPDVLHMHGSLLHAACTGCGDARPWREDLSTATLCASCGRAGGLRPDVVWFGEIPRQMDRIQDALETARLFVSIGTSGTVYPAAGFVEIARHAGAECVELNLEATGNPAFDRVIEGPAARIVPAFVEALLAAEKPE